jgi:hypothetical protein
MKEEIKVENRLERAGGSKEEEEAKAIEKLLQMDISKLTLEQRNVYLWHMAVRKGLDPLTRPFDVLIMQGKAVLFANAGCADQLRELHNINIETVEEGPLRLGDEIRKDVYVVKVKGDRQGRTQVNIGAVSIDGLGGPDLANAVMKAHTKASRRVTLDLCGLGMPDETELSTIRNHGTGTIIDAPARIVPEALPASEPLQRMTASPGNSEMKYPPVPPPVQISNTKIPRA